jgi:integrase
MRPRKHNLHLPPCVYFRHGAYHYVSKGKWTRLGADLATALAEYGRHFDQNKSNRMAVLIDAALEAHRKQKKLAPNTWKQYRLAADKLKHCLQDFEPHQVLHRHIAQVKLDLADAPNTGNRVLTIARIVFAYAAQQQLVDTNPAVGVTRYGEAKRKRLLLPKEYAAIHAAAPAQLQVIMDLCYLTGQRISDVLGIRVDQLRGEDGIYFKQGKTGEELIVRNPELAAVIARAKTMHGNVRAFTLLHNRRGKAPDYDTILEQWRAACKAAGVLDANLHDIRAMSGTAMKKQHGKAAAQALLGHTNPQNTERYLRDREVVEVIGPTFGRRVAG